LAVVELGVLGPRGMDETSRLSKQTGFALTQDEKGGEGLKYSREIHSSIFNQRGGKKMAQNQVSRRKHHRATDEERKKKRNPAKTESELRCGRQVRNSRISGGGPKSVEKKPERRASSAITQPGRWKKRVGTATGHDAGNKRRKREGSLSRH